MLDIQNYYLGVILANPNYSNNLKSQMRWLRNVESDPFYGLAWRQSLIMGVVTLLRKKGDYYYDEDFSYYENELHYELGKTNSFDITLAYVKPFQELYKEEIYFYEQEDVFRNPEKVEEMLGRAYYIMYNKLTKKSTIIINDTERLSLVREEYLKQTLGEKTLRKYRKDGNRNKR